jgi:hypothetical protein
MFNLKINGDAGSVLPSEFTLPDKPAGKAWKNFLRELDAVPGFKIQNATIEIGGKSTQLPTSVAAHTG